VWQARSATLNARVSSATPAPRASSNAANARSGCPAPAHAVIMAAVLSAVSTPPPCACSWRISHQKMAACSSWPAAPQASSRLPHSLGVGQKAASVIMRRTPSTRSNAPA
jgi:hypothetical protein